MDSWDLPAMMGPHTFQSGRLRTHYSAWSVQWVTLTHPPPPTALGYTHFCPSGPTFCLAPAALSAAGLPPHYPTWPRSSSTPVCSLPLTATYNVLARWTTPARSRHHVTDRRGIPHGSASTAHTRPLPSATLGVVLTGRPISVAALAIGVAAFVDAWTGVGYMGGSAVRSRRRLCRFTSHYTLPHYRLPLTVTTALDSADFPDADSRAHGP